MHVDLHDVVVSCLVLCRAGRPIEGAALVKAMQELDADGSGEVDFEEFSVWWPKYCARLTSTRNRSGFDGVLGSAVDEVASQQSDERVKFDAQLLQVVKFMEGKDASELKVEFEALVRRHLCSIMEQSTRAGMCQALHRLAAVAAKRELSFDALCCCNCCLLPAVIGCG